MIIMIIQIQIQIQIQKFIDQNQILHQFTLTISTGQAHVEQSSSGKKLQKNKLKNT